ncbi:MAG: cadherin-like beta sandwich domain-containing protein [Firmicutes bacterium]|nr:cadherin-like beta sandwich domain-containing protein [Bacillota bacterium]
MTNKTLLQKPGIRWALAAVLALLMTAAFLPVQSFAEDGDPSAGTEGFLSEIRIGAAPGYAIDPAFSGEPGEYTFEVLDSINTVAVTPTLSEAGAGGTITVKWTNLNNEQPQEKTVQSGKNQNMTWFRKADTPSGTSFTVEVTKDKETQVYTFTDKVVSHLTGLSVTENGQKVVIDPAFNTNTLEYSATVLASTETVNIKATPYGEGYSVTIAGAAAQGGQADAALTGDTTQIPIVVQGTGFEPLTYTLTVNKVPAVKAVFDTTPEDAGVLLRDNNGDRILPGADGAFTIKAGVEHTYYVTKAGYVSASGTINLSEDTVTEVDLAEAADNPNIDKDTPAQWKNFRNSDSNMAIVSDPTPKSAKATEFHWAKKLGTGWSAAVNQPIIVDGRLITMSGKKIYALNLTTGEVEMEGDLVAAPSYSYTPMTCVDGIILCPLSNGIVQAVNASTLESLWVYTDALKGQALSPIAVNDGYAYTGFWNQESKDANYACFSLTDEDPDDPLEQKAPTWTYTNNGGFYWAGGIAAGDYILVGTDDGCPEGSPGPARILALDAKSGIVADSAGVTGDQRSSISYDPQSQRYFGTTKAGELFSFGFDQETGKILDFRSKVYGGMSTSTPLVYKGAVYWGNSSGLNFSGNNSVIASDVTTLEENWRVPLQGYPQCSMLLSTAYEETEGYVYIYSTYNSQPGGITLIKAKPDAKSTEDDNVIKEEIYDAEGYQQYCISSIISDENGQLFYKNDSCNMLAVGPVNASLDSLTAEGGDPKWDKEFQSSKENYEITVDPGTQSVAFAFEPTEGSSVEINGKTVTDGTWNVKVRDGSGLLEITAVSGTHRKTYTVNIRERSQDATLGALVVNESNAYGSAKTMSPVFDSQGKEFTVYGAGASRSFENVWPDATDKNAAVKVFAISGVPENRLDDKTTGEIYVTAVNNGHNRYACYFDASTAAASPIKLKIQVTSESEDTVRDYYLTVTKSKNADRTEAQAYCDSMDPSEYTGADKEAIQEAKDALQDAITDGTDADVTAALTAAMKAVNESKTTQEKLDELTSALEKANRDLDAAKQDIADAQDSADDALAAAVAAKEEAEQRLAEAEAAIEDLKKAQQDKNAELEEKLQSAQAAAEAAQKAADAAKAMAAEAGNQLKINEAKAQTVKAFRVKKAKKHSAKLRWKKNGNVGGYQIARAAKKKGSYKVIATLNSNGETKYTNKKLKKGKRYYYKVRTFTKINGEVYYGKWTKVKKVRAR